jgi:hypothetical protein
MNTQRIKKIVGNSVLTLIITLFNLGTTLSQDSPKAQQYQKNNPQSLTAEQTVLVKTILSQYNASTLTADEAKAIHEKFREAGIQGGPGTRDAIIAAGFDPEKLRSLAPPPGQNVEQKSKVHSIDDRLKTVQEKIIAPLSLTSDQQKGVLGAFTEFYTAVEKLREGMADPKQRPDRSKIHALEKTRDEKVKQILSETAFVKYLELEKASRPPRPSGVEQTHKEKSN